jgi:exodeoxyribonuclease VII large subunit
MAFESPTNKFPDIAITVSELTEYLRIAMEEHPQLRSCWVVGEVSSANRHPKGLFFTLQDGVASIKCVVWNSQLPKLVETPHPGEQVIVLGSLRLYQQRGEYSLNIWQALPGGQGLQALRYQQLKSRLQQEGLLDVHRKRSLPLHPQIIAVVTSPTAAAWGDIQKTLKKRYPGLQVLFSPAVVQGDLAPQSIVTAIKRVENDGRAEVVILSRGGGAVEELACFNDERVVRAIANCRIPVVTGIGHDRDESLTDLVADAAVHTPTAAAELVVPSFSHLYDEHQQRVQALYQTVCDNIIHCQSQLETMGNRLRRFRLDRQVQQELERFSWMRQRLVQEMKQELQEAKQRLEILQEKLVTLDPEAVLKRGYAVVRNQNGEIVRSCGKLNVGDELLLQLSEGEIRVEVKELPSIN